MLKGTFRLSDPGWNRTSTFLDVGQASSPLDHGIILRQGLQPLGREGIEPLVTHLTSFTTIALQAAVRNTPHSIACEPFSSTRGTRTHTHQVLSLVALPNWRTVL